MIEPAPLLIEGYNQYPHIDKSHIGEQHPYMSAPIAKQERHRIAPYHTNKRNNLLVVAQGKPNRGNRHKEHQCESYPCGEHLVKVIRYIGQEIENRHRPTDEHRTEFLILRL